MTLYPKIEFSFASAAGHTLTQKELIQLCTKNTQRERKKKFLDQGILSYAAEELKPHSSPEAKTNEVGKTVKKILRAWKTRERGPWPSVRKLFKAGQQVSLQGLRGAYIAEGRLVSP